MCVGTDEMRPQGLSGLTKATCWERAEPGLRVQCSVTPQPTQQRSVCLAGGGTWGWRSSHELDFPASLPPPPMPKQYVGSFSVDDLDTQEGVWLVQQQLWALKVGELGRALHWWGSQPWNGPWDHSSDPHPQP